MVAGAVIIGRPIGPGMVRPFTLSDFSEFSETCRFPSFRTCPFEVVYPIVLEDQKVDYHEGILLNWFGNRGDTREAWEADLKGRLINAGKECERLWCASSGKAFTSDLSHHKILHFDGDTYTPYMAVLETYPEREAQARYTCIAARLLFHTREQRVKHYTEAQAHRYTDGIERLAQESMKW